MRNSSDVKCKNIRLENLKFRARVDYYNGKWLDCGLFESLRGAQKVLDKYPRDDWCEADKDDYRYKEVDERQNWRKRSRFYVPQDFSDDQDCGPCQRSSGCDGRSFGGFVPGRDGDE